MNLIWALVLGLTFCVCFFVGVATFLVPGFFDKVWRKLWTPIGLGLMLAFGFMNICAVTQIDLTTQVKGVLPGTNGGTGSANVSFTGPSSAQTYTLPASGATLLSTNAAVTVPQGGTGVATLAAHGVLVGEGTGNVAVTATGSSTQCFISNGASADPTWQACPGGGTWAQEVPTGTINGSNVTFTLANTPISSASVSVYLNGVFQQQGAGNDYTISGSTITYLTAPPTGDKLVVTYQH